MTDTVQAMVRDLKEAECHCKDDTHLCCPCLAAALLLSLQAEKERGCYVLMGVMKAYERRIRSDCTTQEQIDKRPWECAEYNAAADYLRKVWPVDAELSRTKEQTK